MLLAGVVAQAPCPPAFPQDSPDDAARPPPGSRGAPVVAGAPPPDAPAVQLPPGGPGASVAASEEVGRDVWGIGAHPIVGYGPESSVVLGVGAAVYYNSRPEDPDQRLDEYGLNATYSERKQGSISVDATKYLGGDRHVLGASLELMNTPSSFYGIGPNSPASAEEGYTQTGLAFSMALQTRVWGDLYVGPEYGFLYSEIDAEGPLLSAGRIAGSGTTHESGLGVLLSYDTTNAKLYKLTGTRVDLRSAVYHSAIGSAHAFGCTGVGLRRYLSIGERLVLALHLAAQATYGDVPFFSLSSLGGNKLLRGYSSERYRARHFLGGQAELRARLFWRVGAAAFAGAAEVENELAGFGANVRGAAGIGLRVALNAKQTINLRFDLALNTDGEIGKYIRLREAF